MNSIRKTMNHNEAVLIILLQHANKWVPLPEIRAFTKSVCRSECYPVNSRSSDLKNAYGYRTHNKTETHDGIKHSFYKIDISPSELQVLRSLYRTGSIPHFKKVKDRLKPVQKTLFEVEHDWKREYHL